MQKREKVWVGLSGGVDSAVSAALLKRAGYDVTGVFIKVWQPDFLPCTWREDRRDAMRVCAALDIPFKTLDCVESYKRDVVDYLIREYASGRTPNPDVMCNRHIKFGAFLKAARETGVTYVATGHYAQNKIASDGRRELRASVDTEKDQSYFLWTLTQDDLARILFPVGGMRKMDVRAYARALDLPVSGKKDSQGLCFLGKLDMKEFLGHFLPQSPGKVLNEEGAVIGEHLGALFFTLGERHGFKLTVPAHEPHYVIEKDMHANTLTVSRSPRSETKSVRLEAANWITDAPKEEKLYGARARYREELAPCRIKASASGAEVTFTESAPLTPSGQSLVIYEERPDGLLCIGGGIIA